MNGDRGGGAGDYRFGDGQDLIDRDVGERLYDAAGPADFQGIDEGAFAETEVEQRFVLGEVGVGRLVKRGEGFSGGGGADHGTVAIAIGDGAGETQAQPAVAGGGCVVAVEQAIADGIGDEYILAAVVVVVEHHDRATDGVVGDALGDAHVGEDGSVVLEKLGDVGGGGTVEIKPVGDDQVGFAVIVDLEKRRAPAPARVFDAGGGGYVLEFAVPEIFVEAVIWVIGVKTDFYRSKEQIEAPIPVVVGHRRAHVFGLQDAGGGGAVGEGAIPVVPPELGAVKIVNKRQIGKTILVKVGPDAGVAVVPDAGDGLKQTGGGGLVGEVTGGGAALIAQEHRVAGVVGVGADRIFGNVNVQVSVEIVVH